MNYLEQILATTKQHNARQRQSKQVVQGLLTALQERQRQAATAPQAAPTGSGGAGGRHSMGDGHGHSSSAEVKGLNAQFNGALQRLIKDSGGKISVGSGYRSVAEQTKIYNAWKAGTYKVPRVAKPGSSNHNHGLAADLKFLTPDARKFAHANAARYGLRFPMGDEPWHIEPVNAREIRGKR